MRYEYVIQCYMGIENIKFHNYALSEIQFKLYENFHCFYIHMLGCTF